MANRFWEFVGRFIPGTTVRAEPVNDKFDGIESAFEAVEGELDRSIRLPATYTGTRSLPEVDPRECLLYVNASNQLSFYAMAAFNASVNDVAIKHADIVSRHGDIVTRHNNIITRHADIITKHDYVASVANSPAVGALLPLTPVANSLPYYTSGSAAALATLSAFGRSLIDDADAATARATLGAQAADATLTALAGATTAANKLAYFSGVDVVAMADLTAFARTLLDDADAATARETLGAQAADATLTALAGVATAANKVPYFTGTDTAAVFSIESFARAWLGNAYSDPPARHGMKAYGGDLGVLWTGSHVVADSPSTSSIALSSFPTYGVLHVQYLYGSQYGSFAVPYSHGGAFGQRFAIGAGYVSITEITSALIRFQAVGISGSVTITQIWAQV